jgi:2'-5' RNA ligase
MRFFIAINFGDDNRARLLTLRDELQADSQRGNFSQPSNLHLTLAFIGEVNPNKTEKIKAIMDTVTFEPFDITAERIGTYAGGTLWWVGLREEKPLMNLQAEVSHKLALRGFEMDPRKYHPHITLGREVVTDRVPWEIEPFGETVSSIDLMKSERIGGKLIYTEIYSRKANL